MGCLGQIESKRVHEGAIETAVLYQGSRVEGCALWDSNLSIAVLSASKFSVSGFYVESNGFGVWVTQVEKRCNMGLCMTIQKPHTHVHTYTVSNLLLRSNISLT